MISCEIPASLFQQVDGEPRCLWILSHFATYSQPLSMELTDPNDSVINLVHNPSLWLKKKKSENNQETVPQLSYPRNLMIPVRKMYFHLLSLQEGPSAWLRTRSLARVLPAWAHLCFPASSGYTQFPPTFPPCQRKS